MNSVIFSCDSLFSLLFALCHVYEVHQSASAIRDGAGVVVRILHESHMDTHCPVSTNDSINSVLPTNTGESVQLCLHGM